MPYPQSNADDFAALILRLIITIGAAGSAAYWVVLFSRIEAAYIYPMMFVLLLFSAWKRDRPSAALHFNKPTYLLLALCLLAGLVNVFTLSPNADDFSFFQRAIVSSGSLNTAIPNIDTYFELSGSPALSPLHLLTSIEFVVAFTARALGIDALWAIHYGFGTMAAAVVPLPYYLLMRRAGFSDRLSLLGAAGAICFLVLSGNTVRDWGSFTLIRVWQGKCFLVAFILPTVILYAYDFHQNHRKNYRKLLLATAFGLGLSTSAIFLIPFVLYPIVFAPILFRRVRSQLVERIALSLIPLAFLVAALLTPSLGLVPDNMQNYNVWRDLWPSDPYASVALVVSSGTILLLAAVSLLGLLAIPNRQLAAFLAFGYLVWVVSIFLPPVNGLFMQVVLPGAFWRLLYAFPVPFLFGVLVAFPFRIFPKPNTIRLTQAGLCCALLAVFCLTSRPAVNLGNLSWPQANKLSPLNQAAMETMRLSAPQNAIILAPEEVVVSLGLLRPDVRWIWIRETLHVFRNAGMAAEGQVREDALRMVTDCGAFDAATIALASKADLIVYHPGCTLPPEISLAGRQYDRVMMTGYPVLRARL
jgi:hypothetical protein